jgi:RNA polymerase sigma factor (sigma-70 family)
MRSLFRYLRQTALQQQSIGPSDRELLESFLARREEAAFATLLHRHGPMVMGVARRLLGHAQDAEDVFQATFLVLVRKAAVVGNPDLLGNWLYGVAVRTALEARGRISRRRAREIQVDAMPDPVAAEKHVNPELREVLDLELSTLPEKYRVPVVLCGLEGLSRTEVARRLRIPEGTLSSRLATARERLAGKLARRGLALSAAALAQILAPTADACPPVALVAATAQSAQCLVSGGAAAAVASANVLSLVDGVLRAMFLQKLKISAVLVMAIVATGLIIAAASSREWLPDSESLPETPAARHAEPLAAQDPADATDPSPGGDKPKPKEAEKPPVDPRPPDFIRPGDRLQIRVANALPGSPVNDVYTVERSGKVALGPPYGRVSVDGLTLEGAEFAIQLHLELVLKTPAVSVTRYDPVPQSGVAVQLEKLTESIEQLQQEVRSLRTAIEKLKKK